MAAVLKIGNFVEFPVKLEINDAGKPSIHQFKLTGKRLTVPQWAAVFSEGGEYEKASVRDFLLGQITGWSGQHMVVDDGTGQPSAFSPDNFALILDLFGVQDVIFNLYTQAVQQASTPEGKAKN